ncbi:uncharacterized protein DS421_8g231650 [Arachis hypogaea]|nr:uncharacterized protein DS421_8g231650 [Arachis hypogaea]
MFRKGKERKRETGRRQKGKGENRRRRGRRREGGDGAGKGATVAAAAVVWVRGRARERGLSPSCFIVAVARARHHRRSHRRRTQRGERREDPRLAKREGESKNALVGVLLAAAVRARHHWFAISSPLKLLSLSIATRECAADLLLPRANAGAVVMIATTAMKLKGKGVVMLNYALVTSRLHNIMASRRLTRATASSSTTPAPALAPAAPAPVPALARHPLVRVKAQLEAQQAVVNSFITCFDNERS